MTLQTSGTISLDNIQTEFGGTNPIGINEYYAGGSYVPSGTTGTNGAIPSSGQISFSIFYGTSKATESFWYALHVIQGNGTWTNPFLDCDAMSVDSSYNFYSCGYYNYSWGYISKFNSSAVLQWTYIYSTTSRFTSIFNDSSSNSYVAGGSFATKLNSSGTLQWQRSFSIGSGQSAYDSTNNVLYFVGNAGNTNLWKLDSTPTLSWSRTISMTVNSAVIATDPSSNVYVLNGANIFKYNSSGTIQWQRSLSTIYWGYNTTDSSGNVYIVGFVSSSYCEVIKIDTNGTFQWARRINQPIVSTSRYLIKTDSSGNVYVLCGALTSNGPFYIFKYNSSGTLQWQRSTRLSVGTSMSTTEGPVLNVDKNGSVYVSYQVYVYTGFVDQYGSQDFVLYPFIGKIRTDGTVVGSYVISGSPLVSPGASMTFALAASSVSEVAGSATASASSVSESAGSVTASTPSNTLSSLTTAVVKTSV